MSTAVDFSHVDFAYEGSDEGEDVVRDLTLSIPVGQCLVITGLSGCGKTTVTRLINGLIPSVYAGTLQGEVRIAGKTMSEWEMDDLCQVVGSVFQNPRSQFFNLDTTSEIAFGCENLGITRAEIQSRVKDAVRDLGIEDYLDRDIHALSGGERQMIAIASAYALGPAIFVLDEPTASLDADAMRRLADVVKRLKASGKTVIVAEHRLWWLHGIADKIVRMDKGRIAQTWSADEFDALGAQERTALGLRAWRLSEVETQTPQQDTSCKSEADTAILSVQDLHIGYNRTPDVIDGLSHDFAAGHVIALVGRNGAGKTTLARCLTGLKRERAGAVFVEDRPLKWRKRAGRVYLVMQETGYQLFSNSVEGELRLAISQGALDDEEEIDGLVALTLERFGLTAVSSRHPLSLSGGQRQRLAIAAGCLQGAHIMALDEPTSGLDFAHMQCVVCEIARLRDVGACILVITHDYEFLCSACDTVVEIADGRVKRSFALSETSLPQVRELFGFT